MGVVRDVTVEQLAQAVGGIDTSGLVKDSTAQATNTLLGNINTTLGGITTNDPPTDTTQQSIASAITALGSTLGANKADIDGSNIANPSAFRQNIGAQESISSITINTTKKQASVPINTDKSAPDFGYVECYGGTQGTTLTVGGKSYTVSPSVTMRVPLAKGDVVRYTGGGYTTCAIYYVEITASINTN